MLVRDAIRADAANRVSVLTAANVASWVRKQPGFGERPIIVAVDELSSLSENKDAIRAVLSVIAAFVSEIYTQSSKKQLAAGVVTALPTFDITSLSRRQPILVPPIALTSVESRELMKQLCSDVSPLFASF